MDRHRFGILEGGLFVLPKDKPFGSRSFFAPYGGKNKVGSFVCRMSQIMLLYITPTIKGV